MRVLNAGSDYDYLWLGLVELVEAAHSVEVAGDGVEFVRCDLSTEIVELLIGLAVEDSERGDVLGDEFEVGTAARIGDI